jgi:hypothetical protein
VFSTEVIDHGGRDAMQALTRWRHPLASSEALVGCASWGDAPRIAPPHPRGRQNGCRFACIICLVDFVVVVVGHNYKLKTML